MINIKKITKVLIIGLLVFTLTIDTSVFNTAILAGETAPVALVEAEETFEPVTEEEQES